MKKRIWELDALRGLCILGMIAVHFLYDLINLYQLVDWEYPPLLSFLLDWGGVAFLLISGICATLGSRSTRRGILVFGCGMLCTAVTWGMYKLGMAGRGLIIWFGVLHCLGICMLCWPLFKNAPAWALALLGIVFAAAGLYFLENVLVDFPWLVPLGIRYPRFASGDYFPLLPNLGYFLLGAALGKRLYRKKETLLPGVNADAPILRFLRFCGRHSLWIYLLHQPVLTAVFSVITALTH